MSPLLYPGSEQQKRDELRIAAQAALRSSALPTRKAAGPVGSLSCDAVVGPLARRYWKAPFRYDAEGAMIWDARGERALDVRGWGMLTGKAARGMAFPLAEKIQDDFGESVVRALNASWPNIRSEP